MVLKPNEKEAYTHFARPSLKRSGCLACQRHVRNLRVDDNHQQRRQNKIRALSPTLHRPQKWSTHQVWTYVCLLRLLHPDQRVLTDESSDGRIRAFAISHLKDEFCNSYYF